MPNQIAGDKKQTSIVLRKDLLDRVQVLADREGVSRNEMISRLLDQEADKELRKTGKRSG
jgi:metal-responsive CopG/Arc/MetJ family transcriptional regulator